MNLYDFAVQMSSDGEKFFNALGQQVKKSGLRKILVMLANDQAIHRANFEKTKKAERAPLRDARSLTGVLNPFAQRLKRLDRGERLDENLHAEDLYRRGQTLDKECEDFFRTRAARVKDRRLKQAFLGVADEQREHAIALEHLINFVMESQQEIDDAEWSMTELQQ